VGALGLFGTEPGELGDADLLVAHTLAHLACVAIVQEHPSTAVSVLPRLHMALNSCIVVEQAKGLPTRSPRRVHPGGGRPAVFLRPDPQRSPHTRMPSDYQRPAAREVILSFLSDARAGLC